MKQWFCPNCKRKTEKLDNVISIFCGCGHYMISEIKSKEDKDGKE